MAKIRQDMLEQERFTKMIMQEHFADNLSEGVIYSLLLEDTHQLKTEDIPQILELFSLNKMPDFLFLISVEGCNFVESGAPDRDIFQVKIPVEHVLHQVLEKLEYEFIMCTIANTDRIVILLGRGQKEGEPVRPQQLKDLGDRMVEQVKAETREEIAITISKRCIGLNSYPAAYIACRETYDNLFMDTREAVRFAGQEQKRRTSRKITTLEQHRAELISTISALDQDKLQQVLDAIMDCLLKDDMTASQIKLYMASLVSLVTEYFNDLVVDWNDINDASISTARIILDVNYASSLKRVAFRFFCKIANNLKAMYLTKELQLRQRIDHCFEVLYKDPEFNIATVAEQTGYNVSYFGKLFKKIYGVTFNGYLSRYRVSHSKVLLRDTSMPINLVAEQVGFNNYTYYYTVFKAILGVTPQQYRHSSRDMQE